MRKLTLLGVALISLALVAILSFRMGLERGAAESAGATPDGRGSAGANPAAGSPAESDAAGRKVLYWHDPMVPGQRFDKPGKSPFMDMQLVPVYADEAQGTGVSIDSRVAQNLGIRTALVRRASLATSIEAPGNVVMNERAQVVVQARTAGVVEKLFVTATLDRVARGQALLTLHNPEWASALSEYLALRDADIDRALVRAAHARLEHLLIPDEVVEQAERDGKVASRFTMSAPIGGVVAELGVREGMQVQAGTPLFRLADLSTVWVDASVPESQAASARIGTAAEVVVPALPGQAFAGKVTAVLPQVDVATRSVRARIELANRGNVLFPGMFATVQLRSPGGSEVLLVPQEAVISTGRRVVVIVAGDYGRFAPVEVELGRSSGSEVEVRAGLAEGQRVVASGQFLIDSEASLKSALPRLEAAVGTLEAASPAGGGVAKAGANNEIPRVHRGDGRLERLAGGVATLSHDPIPTLKWPAMTMDFRAPGKVVPPTVRPGDAIRFEFVERNGDYELTRVESKGSGK